MKLTILGSGTAAPRLKRNMSGYLLEAGGKKILFDSGAGTIRQLLELKVNLLDIDNIFYTHLHNDHINDLGAIIWSNNYGTARKKPLNIYGPKGFREYFKIFMEKILKPKKLNYKTNVREMFGGTMIKIPINEKTNDTTNQKINKKISLINKTNKNLIMGKNNKNSTKNINNKNQITIKSIKSKHTGSSVSYRVKHNSKSIVYSGDTDYSDEIIKISKDADLLILECSFPYKKDGHLTPELCGKIAAKANAKKLVLTHFYPECDLIDAKKECSKEYNGEVVLAEDFMGIKV